MDFAYDLFNRVGVNDFEYIYRGRFSKDLIRRIIILTEKNVSQLTSAYVVQNRVYFIMVEGLQNITRHQDAPNKYDNDSDYFGIFSIQKMGTSYYVTTGNLIDNTKIESLTNKLERVNSLEKDELKQLHRDILVNGEISDRGGAGLGLIEMARKSGNKLRYKFVPVDNSHSFFYFQIEISSNNDNSQDVSQIAYNQSIDSLQVLNDTFGDHGILLSFTGFFNQSNVLRLLSLIKGEMPRNGLSKKVFSLMVEMLQNISKHGDNLGGAEEGATGVFCLSKIENKFVLTSGNIVANTKVNDFENKLNRVNMLNDSELHECFDNVLLGKHNVDSSTTGLGFVDIRLKTNDKIKYSFKKVNDNFSYFSLQISVIKK